MLPPNPSEIHPSNSSRGNAAVSDPPPRYGSLVPLQVELPQLLGTAPWAQPAAGPGPLPGITFTFTGLMHSFRRRWWSVALGALVGAATLLVGWFLVPPQLEVESILELSRESTEIAATNRAKMDNSEWGMYKATQATLVKTRLALMKALNERDPDTGRPLEELPIVKKESDRYGWLQSKLQVRFPGDASIMLIAMKGEDPKQMVKLVNAVTDTYVNEVKFGEKQRSQLELQKLDEHYRDVDREMLAVRARLDSTAKRLGIIDKNTLSTKLQLLTGELSSLRNRNQQLSSQLTEKQLTLIELRQHLELLGGVEVSDQQIEEKLHENPKYSSKVATREGYLHELRATKATAQDRNSPSVKRIEKKIEILEAEMDDLKQELVHQIRKSLQGDSQQAVEAKIAATETAMGMIEEERTAINQAMSTRQAEIDGLHKNSSELDALQGELRSLEDRMQEISRQKLRAQLNREAESRVRLYNKASVPEGEVDWMRYFMVFSLGGLGFVLPVAGLVAWDYQQRRLNSSSDLPETFGVKLVGYIPALRSLAKKKSTKKDSSSLLMGHNPLADAVDGVRTALMRDAAAESTRIVLVTSPVGREGKTTLAAQLAASLGRAGRRTLLIDGDMRHPSAHRALGVAQEPGLAEILRGEAEIEETVRPTRANGLWMIPAGNCCEEAIHALARDGVQATFKELAAGFDFVIIDGAPVLTDSDALVIGQHVDAAILSVLRDISRVPHAFEARDRLQTVGVRLLGCVYHGAKGEQRTGRPTAKAK